MSRAMWRRKHCAVSDFGRFDRPKSSFGRGNKLDSKSHDALGARMSVPLANPTDIEAGLALVKQGCALIASGGGSSDEVRRLRPAIVLLQEAADITMSVPDAGASGGLRSRLYHAVQAQDGHDDAAFYKELRCSIHIGLAGELSDPVTLPCGHTFCKTCVAPLFKMGASDATRKCPQCRDPIRVAYWSLRVNVAIKGIVDHLLPQGHAYDMAAIAATEAQVPHRL